MDKKITDLTSVSVINGNDVSVIARDGSDYQFVFSDLLQYIKDNVPVGASVSFGTTLPQNTQGKNGDVFINTFANSFAQKINGIWNLKYQYPISEGNTDVLFGLGIPNNVIGNNGDVYINTGTGVFYKKTDNVWIQVFSMATGPAGPPGVKGDNGPAGIDGTAVLSGTSNPSNLIDGKDGDFYINTFTLMMFGPKTGGVWGPGVSVGGGITNDDIGAGLTIDEDDKITLDLTSKALVSPVISVTWTLYESDGVTAYTPSASTSKVLVVDKGVKADMAAKYKYPTPSGTQAAPISSSGSLDVAMPAADIFSDVKNVTAITTNSTYNVVLVKPKSGLIVSGLQVAFPTGNDTTSDSISINFQGRGCLAFFTDTNLTASQIQSVLNTGSAGNTAFQSSKARTFTAVTAVGYTYYLLSNSLGRPTAVTQDGVDAVFGAFHFLTDVMITNAAGQSDTITVMRSNATNAFNNRTVAFN